MIACWIEATFRSVSDDFEAVKSHLGHLLSAGLEGVCGAVVGELTKVPVPIFEAVPETFDALVLAPRGELVVVDFWGKDCPNCEVYAAAEPELLSHLEGERVRVVRVDAYVHEELARRFGLFGIPTFLLFRDGERLGKMSQYAGKAYWLGVIRDHLPPRD